MGRKFRPSKYRQDVPVRRSFFLWEADDSTFIEGIHSHLEDIWLTDLYKQDMLFQMILNEAGRNGVRKMESDELPDPVETDYNVSDLWDTWFSEEHSEDLIPETLRGV